MKKAMSKGVSKRMREMTEEEKVIFEKKKRLPEMKQKVADFFGMRWEDVEPTPSRFFGQQRSSEGTSISQTPRAYSDKGRDIVDKVCMDNFGKRFFIVGNVNFEQGMGKYDFGNEALSSIGVTNRGTDPYNRSEEYNRSSVEGLVGNADTATALNVLNVIDSDEMVDVVVAQAALALKPDGVALFQIYEGDGTNVQRETKANQYQRNWKAKEYLPFVNRYFGESVVHRNMILCRHPLRDKVSECIGDRFVVFEEGR